VRKARAGRRRKEESSFGGGGKNSLVAKEEKDHIRGHFSTLFGERNKEKKKRAAQST